MIVVAHRDGKNNIEVGVTGHLSHKGYLSMDPPFELDMSCHVP